MQNFKSYLFVVAALSAGGVALWLNAALVPFAHVACELNSVASFALPASFLLAGAGALLLSGKALQALGCRQYALTSVAALMAGVLVLIPGAMLRAYPLLVAALGIMGVGAFALLAAVRSGATLGKMGAQGVLLAQCAKVCGAACLLALGVVLFDNIAAFERGVALAEGASRSAEFDVFAYKLVAPCFILLLLLLGLLVAVALRPPLSDGVQAPCALEAGEVSAAPRGALWLVQGMLTIALSLDVLCICSASSYGRSLGIGLDCASLAPVLMLVLSGLGGVLAWRIFVRRTFDIFLLIVLGAAAALAFLSGSILAEGRTSLLLVSLLSLPNAVLVCAAWDAFGKQCDACGLSLSQRYARVAGGLGVAAMLVLLFGGLADVSGYRKAYLLLLPCYALVPPLALRLRGLPAL